MSTPVELPTAEQVAAYFAHHRDVLEKLTANETVSLRAETALISGRLTWTSYAHGGTHLDAKSAEEAIARQVEVMKPENRAARLRREAAAILAEAAKLETEGSAQ